ncbi:restriction endonuclease type II-like protein [Coemansia spiralis]|nr:restriction endonuclease type II-like protein [Coemansia spiralis]
MREAALDLSTSTLRLTQESPISNNINNQSTASAAAQLQSELTVARPNASVLSGSQQRGAETASGRSHSNQTVQVNEIQRGNPLLASIRNVRWSYSKDIIPDYVVGRTSCVLYLSIKYHRLHPEYIAKRIESLGKDYRVRVLLVYVDTDDSKLPLREINRIALLGDMTTLLAWSLDEAGRYIETLKTFENRQPDIIKERVEDTYSAKLNNALTSVRSVNKTDVLTLASNFESFEGIAKAGVDELTMCPGIGDLKAQRLFKAFNEPFIQDA